MNATEFSNEMSSLMTRAYQQGINTGKMSMAELAGVLALNLHGVGATMVSVNAAAAQAKSRIVRSSLLPPNPNGEQRG